MATTQRRITVVGNWKMHGSKEFISDYLKQFFDNMPNKPGVEVLICPPSVYLSEAYQQITAKNHPLLLGLGAQNMHFESKGAFTGEISAAMCRDVGCTHVILGHSERRQKFFEGDLLVARKVVSAYDAGLIPIICIGETLEEREKGLTFEVIKRQLGAVLDMVPFKQWTNGIIAYEPIWAIGTGVTATPEQAEEVHSFLRGWLAENDPEEAKQVPILYGGSVKASNVRGLFSQPNIDGALVGGASIDANEFIQICRSAIE
jgi:triosephosphate isomerase (TIM)